MIHFRLGFTFSLLLLFSAAGVAQVRADLHGRVLDASGAAVANADVELIERTKDIHRSTKSSASGDYVFGDLNPGDYRLEAVATGFQKLSISHVTLAVGQTTSVDLLMTVGGAKEEVTVEAIPPVFSLRPATFRRIFRPRRWSRCR